MPDVILDTQLEQRIRLTDRCLYGGFSRDRETNITERDNHLFFNEVNWYLSSVHYVQVPGLVFWLRRQLRYRPFCKGISHVMERVDTKTGKDSGHPESTSL